MKNSSMMPRSVTSGNIGISKIYSLVNLPHSPMILTVRIDEHITVLPDWAKIKMKNFEKKLRKKEKKITISIQFPEKSGKL